MHRFVLACTCSVAVVAAACGGGSNSKPAADTTATAAAPPAPPPPPALTYADVAGKWNLKVTNPGSDSTILTEVLNATASDTGWTAIRGKLKAVKVRPSLSGDSLITEGGPYPSALHKGVMVTTHTVWHLQNGKLIGTTVGHYAMKKGDSVETHHIEGTKAP